MNINGFLAKLQDTLSPEFITKVVDIGGSYIVSVCGEDGYYPLHMPYRAYLSGKISYFDMASERNQKRYNSGKVIYSDDSMVRDLAGIKLDSAQSSKYRALFKTLGKEYIDYLLEEFGVDVTKATEDSLENVYNAIHDDGGPGSGYHEHPGRPGQVGGSTPMGAAEYKKSMEKAQQLKDCFGSLDKSQKFSYLNGTGIIPLSEAESLRQGIENGDQKSLDRLSELERDYFGNLEYSREARSLEDSKDDYVINMSDEAVKEFVENSINRNLESYEKDWANPTSTAQKVAIDAGLYETPQCLCQEDFDQYVEDSGAVVIYRGTKDLDGISSDNMKFQMMFYNNEPYFGNGIYGDGLYFSTDKEFAEMYATTYGADAKTTKISTCALRPDANVLEYKSSEWSAAKERAGTKDDSIAAICSGYDAIHVPDSDYYVILNRAAMVCLDYQDEEATKIIEAASKG